MAKKKKANPAVAWATRESVAELIELLQPVFDEVVTPRKARLLAVACVSRLDSWLDRTGWAAIRSAEEFAEGGLTRKQLAAACNRYLRAAEDGQTEGEVYAREAVLYLLSAGESDWLDAIHLAVDATCGLNQDQGLPAGRVAECAAQAALMRDIFGNPFRPVAFDPAWRTGTAVALARQMYDSRDFGAMPILADALQDAGCDSEGVLKHCREAGQVHVRGCWVTDLVLGKE